MRACSNDNYSVPTSNKRGVTFDAMETLEWNRDCIDKLTSLVSANDVNENDNRQETVCL